MDPTKVGRNRKFAAGRTWALWDGPRLEGVTPDPVLFYDDPSLEGVPLAWHAGVEVHKRVLVVALYGRAPGLRVLGPILREATTPADAAAMWDAVAVYHPARFLMETSGVYHVPVVRSLRERFPGSQVVVMSAYELSKYVRRTRKNDRVDATRLAQVASVDELLRPSYAPAPADWVLRDMVRYRERQVREVTRQKNRVKKVMAALGWPWDFSFQNKGHVQLLEGFLAQGSPLGAFLKEHAGEVGATTRAALAPWATLQLAAGERTLLMMLLRDMRVRQELQALTEACLVKHSRGFPAVQAFVANVESFPGLGYLEAVEFAAEVGDATRFSNSRRFTVYAGIAPAGGTSGVQVFGSEEEKVVTPDKPAKRSNRQLKAILTRVATVILANCKGTARRDDLYLYTASLAQRNMVPLRRVFKVAAKVGRKLFAVLRAGVPYDGDMEKGAAGAAGETPRGRQARRRQAYVKGGEARRMAEKTADVLLALLRARGLEPEALAAIANVTASDDGTLPLKGGEE